jgi:guanine deaminase
MLIEGGLVLLDNDRFEPVSLVIHDGRIAAILRDGGPDDAERVDASDRLIIPGLVNAHTHSQGALGRGAVEDRTNLEMFLAGVPAINGGRTQDDLWLSAALSAAELIRKGCTTCLDLCVELPRLTAEGLWRVGAAYAQAGMRAVITPMVADRTLWQALPDLLDAFPEPQRDALAALTLAPWRETLETMAQAARDWPHDRAMVRPGVGPTIPLHCSDDFLSGCARLSAEMDLPLHTHLLESKTQARMARARWGAPMAQACDRLGLLSPRTSGAHGIWLEPAEMELLAERGAGIAHNPGSNLRFGSGIAPVAALRAAGVAVGVGTDASNTGDDQNMFEATRLAATLSRIRSFDPEDWISARDAFAMATEGSARLMGWDRVGRIAEGWAADLVLLEQSFCHYAPLRDPLRQIVFAETGAAVREVMVAGAWVFREDRVLGLDEPALRDAAQAAADRLDAANAEARTQAAAASAVVRSFCLGACRTAPWMGRLADEANA